MSEQYAAGLDYSGAGMTFAVTDRASDRVIFDEFLPVSTRTSTNLPVLMKDVLTKNGLAFQDISEWSVGGGPGSFTGLRVAAVFVMGLAFAGKNIRTRAVSTAGMIASCAGSEAERMTVCFDGRKNEQIVFGLRRESGGTYAEDGFSQVIRSADDLKLIPAEYSASAAFAKDHDAVRNVIGDAAAEKVIRVERLSALPLIRFAPDDFSRPLTELTYLRPAVFVEPAHLRSVPGL